MPAQTTPPTFNPTFGARINKAAATAAKAAVRYGPEGLPPGVKQGIGRVTGARLVQVGNDSKMKQGDGTSAAGQWQFVVDATAQEPEKMLTPDGTEVGVRGRRFRSVFIPLFEKGFKGFRLPVQFAQAQDLNFEGLVAEACNFMRVLAGPAFDTSNFQAAVKALDAAKPHFEFNTTESPAGGKNPQTGQPYPARTWENWGRGVKYQGKPAASKVNDGTGAAAAEVNGKPHEAVAPAAEADAPAEFNEFGDLSALADLADSDPDAAATDGTPENDAAAKLTEAAAAAGIGADELGNWANWQEILAEMAKRSGGEASGADDAVADEEEAAEDAVEEAPEWQVKDECNYVPLLKDGKPGKRTVLCVITGFNKAKTKCNVKEKAKPDVKHKDVPVDSLTRPE